MNAVNKLDMQMDIITQDIIETGTIEEKRNGNRICTFGQTIRSNLAEGFPIVTRRKIFFQSALKELLAMLNGNTMAAGFGSSIWDQFGLSKDEIRLAHAGQDEVLTKLAKVYKFDEDPLALAKEAKETLTLELPHIDIEGNRSTVKQDFEPVQIESITDEQLADAITASLVNYHMNDAYYKMLDGNDASHASLSVFVAMVLNNHNVLEADPEAPIEEITFDVVNKFADELVDLEHTEANALINKRYPNTIVNEHVALQKGYCGPIYGAVWLGLHRHGAVDQVARVEALLAEGKDDGTLIIDGWAPEILPNYDLDHDSNILNGKQVLAPCHVMYIFTIMDGKLNLEMTQRSGDHLIGVPSNHIHCALFVHAFAYLYNLEVGTIKHNITNSHIYESQLNDVNIDEFLAGETFELPELVIDTGDDEVKSIADFKPEHFQLKDYKHGDTVKIRCEA